VAALVALGALLVRSYYGPSAAELQRWWVSYAGCRKLDPSSEDAADLRTVQGAVANQLMGIDPGKSPILSIRNDAERRGRWLRAAFVALGVLVTLTFFLVLLATRK
jgi:hypothetical protein